MNSWKPITIVLTAAWLLFWVGWTVDIYLDEDVVVMPFVELAILIPLLAVLAGAFFGKMSRRQQASRSAETERANRKPEKRRPLK